MIKLIGVDLSFEMVRVAKTLNPIHTGGYCHSSAFSLPLPDDSANIIFTSCVLHHITEEYINLVFEELFRVCMPGGLVVLFEHNPYNLITQFVVKTTPLDRNARLITSQQVCHFLSKQSLEVVEKKFFLYGPRRLNTFLDSHARFLIRLPFGGQYYVVARKAAYPVSDDKVNE